jgi:hypothetical protein
MPKVDIFIARQARKYYRCGHISTKLFTVNGFKQSLFSVKNATSAYVRVKIPPKQLERVKSAMKNEPLDKK